LIILTFLLEKLTKNAYVHHKYMLPGFHLIIHFCSLIAVFIYSEKEKYWCGKVAMILRFFKQSTYMSLLFRGTYVTTLTLQVEGGELN